ncbi:holo-ACP synthase [Planctomonas psychrotolerans]|uniref:holo-ACP synthase n=1 Tax=Planctomonas psychrotolerans TaxID=2528712 RepID=UPI001239A367|nr:holo-ACP synthase [Planctomonas psychrotolerans]
MIAGIGVDVVDLARFERSVARTPALVPRLFAESERGLPPRSLAARFAAKEALIKALGGSSGVRWHDMEVVRDEGGDPSFRLHGGMLDLMRARGIDSVHLSMSHDGPVACAFVVTERTGR